MASMPGQATIADVAATAGVSRAAVSKVLRNAYGVSPSMRTRVEAAISALGYRPSIAARSMRGRSFSIGIEMPTIGNAFFAEILGGASGALSDTDYQLVIAPAEADPSGGERALNALADRQVDAVIAISPRVGQDYLDRLARRTPVVMLGRHDDSPHYDTVVGDDEGGARAIMRHLFDLGHTRIAHLTREETADGPEAASPHAIRQRVYLREMRSSGHARHVHVQRTVETQAGAWESTVDLLRSPHPPTAIFAAHDELAIGALRAVIERDAAVAVAGYDGVAIAAHPAMSLTTADQPGAAMGSRAVTMLLERIGGRVDVRHETFAPTLMARASTLGVILPPL